MINFHCRLEEVERVSILSIWGRSIQIKETASSKVLSVLAAPENSYEASEAGMGQRGRMAAQSQIGRAPWAMVRILVSF